MGQTIFELILSLYLNDCIIHHAWASFKASLTQCQLLLISVCTYFISGSITSWCSRWFSNWYVCTPAEVTSVQPLPCYWQYVHLFGSITSWCSRWFLDWFCLSLTECVLHHAWASFEACLTQCQLLLISVCTSFISVSLTPWCRRLFRWMTERLIHCIGGWLILE